MLCARGRLGLVCVGTLGPHSPAGPAHLLGVGCPEIFWKCQDQECPHLILGFGSWAKSSTSTEMLLVDKEQETYSLQPWEGNCWCRSRRLFLLSSPASDSESRVFHEGSRSAGGIVLCSHPPSPDILL